MEMIPSHNPIFKNFSVANILYFAQVSYASHLQFSSRLPTSGISRKVLQLSHSLCIFAHNQKDSVQ